MWQFTETLGEGAYGEYETLMNSLLSIFLSL